MGCNKAPKIVWKASFYEKIFRIRIRIKIELNMNSIFVGWAWSDYKKYKFTERCNWLIVICPLYYGWNDEKHSDESQKHPEWWQSWLSRWEEVFYGT